MMKNKTLPSKPKVTDLSLSFVHANKTIVREDLNLNRKFCRQTSNQGVFVTHPCLCKEVKDDRKKNTILKSKSAQE